jgi:hypothetical protein
VQIREKLRVLFQDAGIKAPFHPGARSQAEVGAVLMVLGFVRIKNLPIGPGPNMTLHDFVGGRDRRVLVHLEYSDRRSGILHSAIEEVVSRHL